MQKTVKAPSMPITSVRNCVRVTISAALFLCGCSSGLKFDTPVKPSEIWVEHKHRPLLAHAAWDVVHFGPATYSKLNGNPPYYVKQADVWIFGTKEGSPSGQQYWVNVIPRGIPSLHYRIATTTSFGSSLGAKENEAVDEYVEKVEGKKIYFREKDRLDPFGDNTIVAGVREVLDLEKREFTRLP